MAQKKSEQNITEDTTAINQKYPVQPIDEAKLKEAWLHLIAYWREHYYDSTEIITLDRKFEWQNPNIILTLENNIQQEIVEEKKGIWIRFLQEKMRNASSIEIITKVIPNSEEKIPYTNAEKWQYLAKKYPVMNLLKTTFGLEID